MRKNFFLIILIVVSGYIGFLLGEQKLKIEYHNWKPVISVEQKLPPVQKNVDFSQFWQVWDKLSENYVDKQALIPQKMVDGAIAGMVSSLGDPYTVYLPPKQNKEAKDDLGGTFEGVGIQLGFNKDKILSVVTPLADTPAYKAGVKAGDLILKIDGQSTANMAIPEAVTKIRGPKGTKVELTLQRNGDAKPIVVSLKRENILVKSVELKFDGDMAIIKLNKFGDRTQSEWGEIISQVAGKKIVLDLRDNPGGYLDGAVYMAGEFLPAGKLVVAQQSGDGSKIDHKVNRNGQLLKEKMVVLVNKGSASAAEILAGALQDYKRAKIVGEQSFGKGSVQQPEDFPNGAGVHITVAKWLRPSGEWIDKIGIKPDVEIKSGEDPEKDLQLDKALEML